MKKIILIILVTVLVLTSKQFFAPGYESISLKSQTYEIPQYAKNKKTELLDIGIDAKNGHLCFSTESSWGDMPFKNKKIDFQKGFMAPTKGFTLIAMGKTDNDIAVIDSDARIVMNGKNGKFYIPVQIKEPSGLAFHKGNYFISDAKTDRIYKLKVKKTKAEILNSYEIPNNICGLDSDGRNLYLCDSDYIYKLNSDFLINIKYNLNGKHINGIISTAKNEFFSIDKNENIIYRFYK